MDFYNVKSAAALILTIVLQFCSSAGEVDLSVNCSEPVILEVSYPGCEPVLCNDVISENCTNVPPKVSINPQALHSDRYLLLMVDPDINRLSQEAYYLHWFITDIPKHSLINGSLEDGDHKITYKHPNPPTGERHRYQFFMFEQKEPDTMGTNQFGVLSFLTVLSSFNDARNRIQTKERFLNFLSTRSILGDRVGVYTHLQGFQTATTEPTTTPPTTTAPITTQLPVVRETLPQTTDSLILTIPIVQITHVPSTTVQYTTSAPSTIPEEISTTSEEITEPAANSTTTSTTAAIPQPSAAPLPTSTRKFKNKPLLIAVHEKKAMKKLSENVEEEDLSKKIKETSTTDADESIPQWLIAIGILTGLAGVTLAVVISTWKLRASKETVKKSEDLPVQELSVMADVKSGDSYLSKGSRSTHASKGSDLMSKISGEDQIESQDLLGTFDDIGTSVDNRASVATRGSVDAGVSASITNVSTETVSPLASAIA